MRVSILKSLVLATFLVSSSAFALGNSSGGGGYVKACYDNNGNLSEVELLDIYEAKSDGLNITEYSDFDSGLQEVFSRLFVDRDWNAESYFDTAKKLMKSYKRIPEGTTLEETNDAFPVFKPINCKYEQVANFYNMSTIWIDGRLYDKMSITNKIALIAHETIYWLDRNSGATNSRYTRKVIGHVMAGNKMESPGQASSYPNSKGCDGSKDGKLTVLYLVPSETEKGVYEVNFQALNGHIIYSKKTGHVTLSKHGPTYSTSELSSQIDEDESITVSDPKFHRGNLTFKLSWQGTEPGDQFKNVEMHCWPTVTRARKGL